MCFFVKGVWQKGLTLAGVWLVLNIVYAVVDLPHGAVQGASVGVAAATMSVANYAHYLHYVRGSQSWNLFEGYGKWR
ncbi:DUF2628 domain-containing protein [Mycobacteroides abscessus subsp. massiliense]